MAGDVNPAGAWKIFKSITFSRGATWAMMRPRILLLFVQNVTEKPIGNPRFSGY
jgi:hypothetical protein